MAGPRRNDLDAGSAPPSGRDPYRVQGNRIDSSVTAAAIERLFVARDGAYAIDDVGRAHVFDALGALVASVAVGPIADAALHFTEAETRNGSALAVSAYGKGVTSIRAAAADGTGRRSLSNGAAVLACATAAEGLMIGDQAGDLTHVFVEARAGHAAPLRLRAPILSIATSDTELAALTADGEALVGTWPHHGALATVRGLRAKRPFRLVAQRARAGFVLLDRERVHAIAGDAVVHASRDFAEGILAYDTTPAGGWLLTDLGRLHHLDASLRASPAISLGVGGRARGLSAVGELAAVWTTRGEVVLVGPGERVSVLVTEGALAASADPRTGDVVVLHGARGLVLRRHSTS